MTTNDELRAALAALVSGEHAGLCECESDYFCVYCQAEPDMSPDVVAARHLADCPIRLGRQALQLPPATITPVDADRALPIARQVHRDEDKE